MGRITKLESTKQTNTSTSYSVKQKNPRNIFSLYTSEFSSLDTTKIKFYLESARKGVNFWKALLFDEIRRRDSHIGAVCQTRKLSVAACPFELVTEDDKAKEFIQDVFKQFNILNFISDIVEASVQGVSLFEINYEYRESLGTVPTDIVLIPNHLVLYDENIDEYKLLNIETADYFNIRAASANSLQDSIDVNQFPQINIDPLKLIEVHSFDGNSRNGLQNGCIDSLLWIYFFKSYGIKDWATYIERYSIPLRMGKYDPMMGTAEKNSLLDAVKNIGHNAYAVFPNTAEIQFLTDTGKGNSNELFGKFIEHWNEQVSIRVLGQTLTTKMEGTGSYAAAKVHDNVRKDIMNSDMKLVELTVNNLIRRIIDLNFATSEYPVFKFTEAENLDYLKIKSEIYMNLKNIGITISPESIKEEFEIEIVETPEPAKQNKFSEDTEKEADDEIEKLINEIWHTQQKKTS